MTFYIPVEQMFYHLVFSRSFWSVLGEIPLKLLPRCDLFPPDKVKFYNFISIKGMLV